MRLFTLDEAVQITTELFDQYVIPVGKSFMTGEIPSVMLTIQRIGSKEDDWLAQVRFKDTAQVSVLRCHVCLDDVFRLCRNGKIYLLTKEIFQVAALYAMLHPLYQTQYKDFTKNLVLDYESMMAGAGEETYKFLSRYYPFSEDHIERTVLDIFRYQMMIFTNHPKGERIQFKCKHAQSDYEGYMLKHYELPYRTARYRKACTDMVDQDGYIVLERLTEGGDDHAS